MPKILAAPEAVIDAGLASDRSHNQFSAPGLIRLVGQAEHALHGVDGVQGLLPLLIVAAGVSHAGIGAKALQSGKTGFKIPSAGELNPLDLGLLQVGWLKLKQAGASVEPPDEIGVDEIVVFIQETRQAEVAVTPLAPDAKLVAVAALRFQLRVGQGGVSADKIGERAIHIVIGRRAEALGKLRMQRIRFVEMEHRAQLERHLMVFKFLRHRRAAIAS